MPTNLQLGGGVGGVGKGTISLVGQVQLGNETSIADTLNYGLSNANSPCYVEEKDLVNGSNTVTIPTKSAGVVIMPSTDADFGATLKGVGGDTGILLSKVAPHQLTFQSPPPANFVLEWGGRAKLNVAVVADAGTDKITLNAHGLENGDRVKFRSIAGSVPGGLTANVLYYVINKDANTFELSTSAGGTKIDLTTTGSGVLLSTVDKFKFFWF